MQLCHFDSKVTMQNQNSSYDISVEGRLDHTSTSQFTRIYDDILEADVIRVDFSKCDFIDSLGLGQLLMLRNKLNQKKNKIKITGLNDEVREIFSVVRFDKIMDIE